MPQNTPLIADSNYKFDQNSVEQPLSSSHLNSLIGLLLEHLPIRQVKLTGGEPLISPLLKPVINKLNEDGVQDISLTTNAVHLAAMAGFLKESGVRKVNVSLDALDADVFSRMTRTNGLKFVLKGIDEALKKGLQLKLNTVIVKDINEGQIVPLLNFAQERGITVRFLELMEMGALFGHSKDLIVTQEEILAYIQNKTKVVPIIRKASSTANYWETSSGARFGIIANHSVPFCHDCNRLRLDSSGKLYGCITDEQGIDASQITEGKELSGILAEAMTRKQNRFTGSHKTMISLGG